MKFHMKLIASLRTNLQEREEVKSEIKAEKNEKGENKQA